MKMRVFLLSLMLCVSRFALAQETGIVAVGGEFLIRIRVPAEGMSVQQRVDAVTDRLPDILGLPRIRPDDIKIVTTKKKTVKIMVQNYLFITVTPEDGKANKLSTVAQANVWVKQLRAVLPRINARPNLNNEKP